MRKTDYAAFTDIIRSRVNAEELGRDYGLQVGRDGRCACIFCDGNRKDTLKLYNGDRGYYCFRCHARGDVISLYQKLTGCGFRQAVEGLNDQYGLGLPLDGADPDAERRARAEAERRKAERARKEQEQRELLRKYWDAADAVHILEEVRQTCAPETRDELWRQRFILSLRYLDELRDHRDRLFDELFQAPNFFLQK